MGGGGGGIRTLGGVAPTTIFETVPFNRSGTPPQQEWTDQVHQATNNSLNEMI